MLSNGFFTPQSVLPRYLIYSFLIHVTLVGWLTVANLSKKVTKTYYSVDFLGGLPSGSDARLETQKAKESQKEKVKIINPQEDLLLKSKKKLAKNEKEIVSTVPAIPSVPVPKFASRAGQNVSSEIPGTGSGVGIGLGGGFGDGSGAGNFPYTWYVHSIKKKLDSNWNVTTGFSNKIYTQVAFVIRRDGTIANIKVEESSKNEIFDRAALRAVEYTNPLPPLPSDFPESELRVHVRFVVKK